MAEGATYKSREETLTMRTWKCLGFVALLFALDATSWRRLHVGSVL